MANVILGQHFDIGQRPVYEDRAAVQPNLKSPAGKPLAVAIVADGVGGANKGELAAQTAVDTVISTLENCTEETVPDALLCAVEAANRAVYARMQELGGGNIGCTLAIAAVEANKTLYIANVGDSRIYLSRGTKLTQLSHDHVNRRGELMRVIGVLPQMKGDVGFYVNTDDETVANERGYDGLPLKKGDSVLVCSDGLVKASPQGQPYTTEQEIVDVLRKKEGDNAAKTLVSYALGRNADDNVTAAIIQTYDPSRRNRERLIWRGVMAGLAALAVVAFIAVLGMFQTQGQLGSVAQAATLNVANLTATQNVIGSQTPTPTATVTATPTALPTLAPGQLGFWRAASGGPGAPFTANQAIAANQDWYVSIPYNGAAGGNFYLRAGSSVTFTSLFNEQMALILGPNSNMFLQTGLYRNGAAITLRQAPGVQLFVQGSCMAAYYRSPTEVAVSCYEGNCSYSTSLGGQVATIPMKQQVILNTANIANVTVTGGGPISAAEAEAYKLQLDRMGEGQADILACRINDLIPTPTPTQRPTRVIPTVMGLPTLLPPTQPPVVVPTQPPQQPPPQPPPPQPTQPPPNDPPPPPDNPPPIPTPNNPPPDDPKKTEEPPPPDDPPPDDPPPDDPPPEDPPPDDPPPDDPPPDNPPPETTQAAMPPNEG